MRRRIPAARVSSSSAPPPPLASGGSSFRLRAGLELSEMLTEKVERAPPRQRGARRVVARPLIAIEPVIGRIEMDGDGRMRRLDLLDAGHWDVRVALAEMQHRRRARLQVV